MSETSAQPQTGKIDAKIITKFWHPEDSGNASKWFSIDLHDSKHSVVVEPEQMRVHVAEGPGFQRVRDSSWPFRSILRFEALQSGVSITTAGNDPEQSSVVRPVTVVLMTHSDLLGDAGQIRIIDLGTTPSPSVVPLVCHNTQWTEQTVAAEVQRIAKEALDWVAKANAVLGNWQRTAVPGLKIRSDRFSHRVIAELLSQNDDPPELGEGIGSMFARKTIADKKTVQDFEQGWWDVGAIERIIREPKHLCFLLNSLRGYVTSTALHNWLTTPVEQLKGKLDPYLGRGDNAKSLRYAANRLKNSMTDFEMPWLYFGYSQFHEDRLFSSLANLVLDVEGQGGVGLIPHVLDYTLKSQRGPRESDFRLMNGSAFASTELPLPQRAIFQHNGYNMYVRTDYLRSLLENKNQDQMPDTVRSAATRLMQGGHTRDDQNIQADLSARCWIACEAGVPWVSGTEFEKIMRAIENGARNASEEISPLPASDVDGQILGFDDLFEDFVLGKRHAFVGGSLHDRLIERWLLNLDPPVFSRLMNRDDFANLSVGLDSCNYVVFGGELRKSLARHTGHEKTEFIEALDQFLIKVGVALTQIAFDATAKNEGAADVARFLAAQLALVPFDPHCIRQWRWSFISHLDDFNPLVRVDTTCPVYAGSVRTPTTGIFSK